MSYIPEYHENYYRVEGTAYNQGKIGIGTINPVQLLHISGGNIRVDGTGYVNGDLNVTGNLNVYGTAAQFAVQQIYAEDKNIEINVQTGTPIGGSGLYTTSAISDDAGAVDGGITLKSTSTDTARKVQDKLIYYRSNEPESGWVSNLRWVVSGNYGKNTLTLVDPQDTTNNRNIGLSISGANTTDAVNLYRISGNSLATDDQFAITVDSGKNTLHLSNTTANVGMTIGHDTVLYRSGADVLATDDRFGITLDDGKRTLHLSNTTANVGMTIGHDTVLYRSGANVLSTDDRLATTLNDGKITLHLTNDTANVGMTIGNDSASNVNLYRISGNSLATDGQFAITVNSGKNTLHLNNTTANVGMTIGQDVNLYRSAADTLKTDDNLIVDLNLNVNANSTLGNANTDTTIIRGITKIADSSQTNGVLFGTADASYDTNLYRSAADTLKTDDSFIVDGAAFTVNSATITLGDTATDTVTINAGPISLINATAAADALEFGAGANLANLYRSANDTLKTDDNLIVNVNLTANGNATLGDATTDTHTVNGTLTNSLPDNTATAVDFKESTNSYLKLTTTDSSEVVTIGATPKFTSLNTTEATNSATAAATFAGGVGIAKKLYVGTDLTIVGNEMVSVSATVTAGTDAQAQGPLTKDVNIITTNASNPGAVTLPTAQAGMRIMIRNTTANGLKVYPATSAQIDALGVNAAFGTTLTTNTQKQFYAISATQWYSI